MANILAIDTSLDYCSVAVSSNESVIWEKVEKKEKSHAQNLPLMVDEVMKELKTMEIELNALAISAGPGSYTGLRIGCGLVKGLCVGLDLPLIAISTLEGMVNQAMEEVELRGFDYYVPMIDARRMEVYYGVFDSAGNRIEEDTAIVLEESSFQDSRNRGRCLFFGSGSRKFQDLVKQNDCFFENELLPLASGILVKAQQKFVNKDFEDLAYFEPKYVKDVFVTKPKPLFK